MEVEKIKYAIGLMSGTSLDGVDLVYVKFYSDDNFEILKADTVSYSSYWLAILKDIALLPKNDSKLKRLDIELGCYYGNVILEFIQNNKIDCCDFIASHGHTVHHQPQEKYTLQIGCGKEIYKQTKIKTIYDFRTQDVMLGGQGAPLVPIGDELMFSTYEYCLNLGGFSNVSFQENGVRKAFDICPVNTVLNFYANKNGLSYDDNGILSARGVMSEELLNELNAIPFYKSKQPKSLGVEFVKQEILPVLSKYQLSDFDLMRTFVEHIAIQISKKIHFGKVLVTGGGVFNGFLMARIKDLNPSVSFKIPSKQLIEYKEALIFALLGKLKDEEKVNCLSSVTGSSKNHSSGVIVG